VLGKPYSTTLTTAGGNPPVTWSISSGSLPSWATLDTSTGAITGTPNAAATTTFTVKATDSTAPTAQTATKQLSIQVNSALTVSTTSLPGGSTGTAYSATLAATGGVTPYTWSVISGSFPGWANLDAGTGAITGTPNAGGTSSFTVQVTDNSSPQQTATQPLSITVTVPTLTVTTTNSNLPAGTVSSAYPNTSLTATGGILPYSWSWVAASGSTLPPGLSLSPGGQISGTPTSADTFNVVVTVTDSTTATANANLSITVSPAPTCVTMGSEALLKGQYAFVLKGFDSSGNPALIGGVLTFNGSGTISAGTIDLNGNSTAGIQTSTLTSGTYGIGSDQRGCMVITTAVGTQNYRFSVGNISGTPAVASTGHMIGFDTGGPFTEGIMRKQTTSAFGTGSSQISGNYVFGVSSVQNSANTNGGISGGKFGAVGVFNLSSGSVTGGEIDFNGNGELDGNASLVDWPSSPISIDSGGTYTVSSTTGRGTLSFTPNTTGASAVGNIIYVVSSTEVLAMCSDPQTSNNLFAGELMKQSGTPFAATPLSGTYIGYASGLGRSDIILLGPLTSGSGTLTGTRLRNDGGTFSSAAAGGTYSASQTGRMTITVSGSHHQPVLYLVSSSQAFYLNGNAGVDAGFFQLQSGSSFSNSSVIGTYAYGTIDPEASGGNQSGVAVFASPDNVTATQDENNNGTLTLAGSNSLNYSVDSTGLGMIPSSGSSCTVSASSTTCQTLFYIISPSQAVVMDTQTSNPKLQIADK